MREKPIVAIDEIEELNIGHSIVARAVHALESERPRARMVEATRATLKAFAPELPLLRRLRRAATASTCSRSTMHSMTPSPMPQRGREC